MEITSHTLNFAGQASRICVARDVTDQIAIRQQLAHQALHDQLTGLPNRTLFLDRLNQALVRAKWPRTRVAVLYLNLDNFKLVNDSIGHESGDALLQQVAERLSACIRPVDTVGRQGGDEFVMVLDGLRGIADATRMAETIARAMQPAFRIAGREIYVTVSIGISITNAAVTPAGDLLRGSDIAMYEAKRLGGARYAIFDPRRMEQAWRMYGLQGDLRQAIDNGELTLVYQPLVDLDDMEIRQVEALVRWNHPKRGDLSPAEFIPLAESSGLVILLGEWVLEQACRQLRQWQVTDPDRSAWSIAVNISAKQLAHPHLVDTVRTILTETGLDPATLELEITESAVVEDMETTKRTLRALKELGLRLVIDDFGAGYAGLSYLRDWDVDALKIDRSYVAGLGKSPEDTAMIRAVLDVATSLGLEVTAEGVETPEQLAQLRAMGCTRGQGFIFGRPTPANAVPTAIDTSISTPV